MDNWKLTKITPCVYDNKNRSIGMPTSDPSWEVVETMIRHLDGECHSGLHMEGPRDAVMTVAGGNSVFCVSVIAHSYGPYELMSLLDSDEETPVLLFGIETSVPRFLQADLALAIAAAKYFFDTGLIDPALKWMAC